MLQDNSQQPEMIISKFKRGMENIKEGGRYHDKTLDSSRPPLTLYTYIYNKYH